MSATSTSNHRQRTSGDPRSLAGRPTGRAALLGQVFTPAAIARQMADELLRGDSRRDGLAILDPCVGPATFPQALAPRLTPRDQLVAIDVDRAMVAATSSRLSGASFGVSVKKADYLGWESPTQYHAVIMNPPYLRQEWIDNKHSLRARFERNWDVRIPGTANMYVYFLVKALHDLRVGGRLVAIVYDSWTYTRYGQWLSQFLNERSTSLRVHPVAPQPFDGRLIDANIISLVKGARRSRRSVHRARPAVRDHATMRPVSEAYATRRGLRLKQSEFFLCSVLEVDALGATQFLKHVRHVEGYAASELHPQAALLVRHPEDRPLVMAELVRRLAAARLEPQRFRTILTWAEERPESWFAHARPPHAPILFNYYVRGRPRHFLSRGIAYADNFYGLTPMRDVPVAACVAALNSSFTVAELQRRGRSQGNGLLKLQLFEYREVRTPAVHLLTTPVRDALTDLGELLICGHDPAQTLKAIDALLEEALGIPVPVIPDGR